MVELSKNIFWDILFFNFFMSFLPLSWPVSSSCCYYFIMFLYCFDIIDSFLLSILSVFLFFWFSLSLCWGMKTRDFSSSCFLKALWLASYTALAVQRVRPGTSFRLLCLWFFSRLLSILLVFLLVWPRHFCTRSACFYAFRFKSL